MVCPKCGNKDNKKNICSKCGYKIDSQIKITTYDDEEVIVDAPIITESHTFISEEDFQKALKERIEQEEQEKKSSEQRQKHNIIFAGVMLAVIILLIVIVPNAFLKGDKEVNNATSSEDFTSTEWSSGEIKIDGVKFSLKDKYKKFVKNDWTVNLEKYGYENGYILNSGDKTSTTIQLNNPKYSLALAQVGFINTSKEPTDIKNCEIWSISINNLDSLSPIPFELPGGIKNGSTQEEIFQAYGELSEDKIYRSDASGYTTYHYQSSYDNYLDLYVYDGQGLLEINFKSY